MKHTPGPWELEKKSDQTGEWFEIVAEMYCLHRSGVVADTLNRDCVITSEEDRANARLIAAAPDLLEACELAVTHILMSPEAHSSASTLKSLEAAIAKASGGTP